MHLRFLLIAFLGLRAFAAAPPPDAPPMPSGIQVLDYGKTSDFPIAWSKAIKLQVLLKTDDYMVVLGYRIPGERQWGWLEAADSLSLLCEDLNIAFLDGSQAHFPVMGRAARGKWSMLLVPEGEGVGATVSESLQPKTFLWIKAPPKLPVPPRRFDPREGQPPQPTSQQLFGEILKQEKKRGMQSGEPIWVAPVKKTPRLAASLMIVYGRAEWKPPAQESLLVVLEGAADVRSGSSAQAATEKTFVRIPKRFGKSLSISRSSPGAFCALLVTIGP